MGYALLLQRCCIVELVLQLPLCSPNIRFAIHSTAFGILLNRSCVDLRGVDEMTFSFDLGHPFRPFEQLMGVLPAASKDLIPQAYQVCYLKISFFSPHIDIIIGLDVRP